MSLLLLVRSSAATAAVVRKPFTGWATALDTMSTTAGHTGTRYPVGQFPGTFVSVYLAGTTTLAPDVWPNPRLVNPDGSFHVMGDALAYDLKFWRSEIP